MQKTAFLLSFIMVCVLQSCNRRECANTNPVFNEYQPGDIAYKDEVIEKIMGTEDGFRYIVTGYEEEGDKQYLNVAIQGDSICAEVSLLLLKTDHVIKHLTEVKGLGYHHAELKGLKFTIIENHTSTEFVYIGAERIID